jgi:hypothetical protein
MVLLFCKDNVFFFHIAFIYMKHEINPFHFFSFLPCVLIFTRIFCYIVTVLLLSEYQRFIFVTTCKPKFVTHLKLCYQLTRINNFA